MGMCCAGQREGPLRKRIAEHRRTLPSPKVQACKFQALAVKACPNFEAALFGRSIHSACLSCGVRTHPLLMRRQSEMQPRAQSASLSSWAAAQPRPPAMPMVPPASQQSQTQRQRRLHQQRTTPQPAVRRRQQPRQSPTRPPRQRSRLLSRRQRRQQNVRRPSRRQRQQSLRQRMPRPLKKGSHQR